MKMKLIMHVPLQPVLASFHLNTDKSQMLLQNDFLTESFMFHSWIFP